MFIGVCCVGLGGCGGPSSWWRSTDAPPPADNAASPTGTPNGGPLDSRLALARLCERRGQIEQAKRLYQAYLDNNPPLVLPHHRLGVIAAREGRFAEAEEHFRIAGQLAPPSADLLCDIGYAYYLQHRLPEAEQVLNRALAQDPKHRATLNNLGLVLGAQGRFADSLAMFRQVGSEAEAHANLGYVLAMSGKLKEAQDAYLRALTLDGRLKAAAGALVQVAQRRQTHAMLAARRGAAARTASEGMLAGSPSDCPTTGRNFTNVGPESGPAVYISNPRRLPPVDAAHSMAARPRRAWQ